MLEWAIGVMDTTHVSMWDLTVLWAKGGLCGPMALQRPFAMKYTLAPGAGGGAGADEFVAAQKF